MADHLALAEADPEVRAVRDYVTELTSFQVVDPATYEQGDEILGAIKTRIDRVKAVFDPICDAAYKAHNAATTKRAEFLRPLEALKAHVGQEMGTWKDDQERLRRAEELRQQEEAQREDEALRLAAAAQVEREGDPALAAAMLEEAVTTPAPAVVVPSTVPTLQHASIPLRYAAEVYDLRALLQATLDNRVPMSAIEPNMTYLNTRARLEKKALTIPGVRVVPVHRPRFR